MQTDMDIQTVTRKTGKRRKLLENTKNITKMHILVLQLHRVLCCPRDKSRTVRKIIQDVIYPAYKKKNVYMPASCPFVEERDMYYPHETHKTEEAYARWACEYCGKVFYAETYLDEHLQNRHADKIFKGSDAVCLSDYCDIFRCDIVSGAIKPDFWDSALCIDDDMVDMVNKCNTAFSKCRPNELSGNESSQFMKKMKSRVCSLLTCSRYWDTGQVDKSQWKMLMKTVLTVLLFSFMIIYYFLWYHHFYAEALFDEAPSGYSRDYRYNPPVRKVHRKHRHRHVQPLT